MNKEKSIIPIFFTVDDTYIPFLSVTLQSILEKSNNDYNYEIKILYAKLSDESKKKISKCERDNITIEYVDVSEYLEKVKDKLYTRDYFSMTTYFRLFIASLYPQYNKAIYLDSDIVVLRDIAELYNIDLGDNLVGAVPDDIIQKNKVFQEYVEKVVGVSSYRNYFNAGVLVMNLEKLRNYHFEEKFVYLLGTVKYAVIQDQDYLNRICKGRVKLIDSSWNIMPSASAKEIEEENIKLIHYNYQYKPWHYDNILYSKYFWNYASRTEFYNELKKMKEDFNEEMEKADREADKNLRALAQMEADCVGDDRPKKSVIQEKSKERLEILEKIERLEKEGRFDVDAEDDPPTIPLTPENVDYLKEKSTSKFKNILANKVGERFLNNLLKDNKLIIKEINGMENLQSVETGAIITCNHFNPFDSFSIEQTFRLSGKANDKKLHIVIREGNYTNFPGLYGFFFRNCDTLPLSSNKRTMIEFMKAVDTILQRGDFILIYPEQSMWWNYRKPKPLKNGAFKMAAKNNVPVIPIFITMEDSDIIGEDGFAVQEYTINIEKPIYPDESLSLKDNAEMMKEQNYQIWKEIYEDFYKIPLEYTTKKEEVSVVNGK